MQTGSFSLAAPENIADKVAGRDHCTPVRGVAGSMHSCFLPADTLESLQHPGWSCKCFSFSFFSNTFFIVSLEPFCQALLDCLFPLRSAIVAVSPPPSRQQKRLCGVRTDFSDVTLNFRKRWRRQSREGKPRAKDFVPFEHDSFEGTRPPRLTRPPCGPNPSCYFQCTYVHKHEHNHRIAKRKKKDIIITSPNFPVV